MEILVCCQHVDSATFFVEGNAAINESEKRVIATDANTESWVNLRAALTDENVPSDDDLAAEFFHAETLAAGVATVLDGALSFFMGHGSR